MFVSELFEEHGIARVSVWTDQHQVCSFSADGENLEPLFLSEEVYKALEEEVCNFLRHKKCYGYNIFDFDRSKGVVYVQESRLQYAGEVLLGDDFCSFSEHWLNKNEIELQVYCDK